MPPKELEVARYQKKFHKSNKDRYFRKMRHFQSSFEMCGGAAAEAPNNRLVRHEVVCVAVMPVYGTSPAVLPAVSYQHVRHW